MARSEEPARTECREWGTSVGVFVKEETNEPAALSVELRGLAQMARGALAATGRHADVTIAAGWLESHWRYLPCLGVERAGMNERERE